MLLREFKEFHDRAMNELGHEHKVAYFKDQKDYRPDPGAKTEYDDLLDDLDDLDSLN